MRQKYGKSIQVPMGNSSTLHVGRLNETIQFSKVIY